jgi:hypothetical protein
MHDAGAARTSFDCLASPSCVVSEVIMASGATTTVTFGGEGFTPLGGDRFGPSGIVVENASLVAVSAVPEPTASAMLCVGLLALGAAWRRRAKLASSRTAIDWLPAGVHSHRRAAARGQAWFQLSKIVSPIPRFCCSGTLPPTRC